MDINITDALILLPALGFPAIAECDNNGRYRVFVSILLKVPSGNWPASQKKQKQISDIKCRAISKLLGIENFDTHYDDSNWPIFKGGFNEGDIRLLKRFDTANKVFWLSELGKSVFSFKKAFNPKNKKIIFHEEFMLYLPQDIKPGMYGLVCRHEREQLKAYLKGKLTSTSIKKMLLSLEEPGIKTKGLEKMMNFFKIGLKERYSEKIFEGILSILEKEGIIRFRREVRNYLANLRNSKTSNERPIIPHHPIYIPPKNRKYLNIAHLSDTHVSRRWEAMHYWSKVRKNELKGDHWDRFNNPNQRLEEALRDISNNKNDDSVDLIIITGDLTDYNFGYWPTQEYTKSEKYYFEHSLLNYFFNHNMSLFYELLVKYYYSQQKKGKSIKPIFTILGNHDYRSMPYGLIIEWLGQNYAFKIGIDAHKTKENVNHQIHALEQIYPKELVTKPVPMSLQTIYEAVRWYNFVINPALDYAFEYKNSAFLFLDWRKDEKIFGEGGEKQIPIPVKKLVPQFRVFGNPWANNSFTEEQRAMVEKVLKKNQGKVVIISMHATVFCTPDSGHNHGIIVDEKELKLRAYKNEHLALGTFEKNRKWFIDFSISESTKHKPESNKSNTCVIVLSGHAHKNRFYYIHNNEVIDYYLKFKQKHDQWIRFSKGACPMFFVTTSSAYIMKTYEDKKEPLIQKLAHSSFIVPGYRAVNFDEIESRIVRTKLNPLIIPPN